MGLSGRALAYTLEAPGLQPQHHKAKEKENERKQAGTKEHEHKF